MRILFLSRWFPFPANNGSKLRIHNLLRGLSQHHDVTLLSFSDQPEVSREAVKSQSVCSDVHVIPWHEFDPHSLRARLGFLSLKPRSVIDTFSREMAEKITELLSTRQYDLVIASQLSTAAYHPYFRHVPAVFEELEIGLSLDDLRRTLDWKKRLRLSLTWFKLHRYLSRLLDSFQAVTVVSKQEEQLVLENFPKVKRVQVIPNCMNMDEYTDVHRDVRPNTLIFTGSFRYYVNYDAMKWFVGEVFPLILEEVPSAELIITGDHADLPLPPCKNVTLAGYVDDVKSLIASSTVALAPLLSGGGTRLKILEAMAIGTPVVATSKGAEGLGAVPGEHLCLADDPRQFAENIIHLLGDVRLRNRNSKNARQFVAENYDWHGVMPFFLELVERASGK